MTSKATIHTFLFLLLFCVFFLLPVIAFANGFTPLEPLGGALNGGSSGSSGSDFNSYLNALFDLGLALAAVLAVVMLVVGGFRYITSEAFGDKASAKNQIKDAIIGLILALSVVLILRTINPNIVELDLNLKSTGIKADNTLQNFAGGTQAQFEQAQANAQRQQEEFNEQQRQIEETSNQRTQFSSNTGSFTSGVAVKSYGQTGSHLELHIINDPTLQGNAATFEYSGVLSVEQYGIIQDQAAQNGLDVSIQEDLNRVTIYPNQ